MRHRPLVWIAVCWIGGHSAAAALSLQGAALVGAGVMLMLGVAAFRKPDLRRIAIACFAAYVLAVGWRWWTDARNVPEWPLHYAQAAPHIQSPAYKAELVGRIASEIRLDGDLVQFEFDVTEGIVAQTVAAVQTIPEVEMLNSPSDPAEQAYTSYRARVQLRLRLAAQEEGVLAASWQRGDRLRVAGELQVPAQATLFDGFDYRHYLRYQRIHWLLQVDGAARVEQLDDNVQFDTLHILRALDRLRQRLQAQMTEQFGEGVQTGFMLGLVLGIRTELDPEQFRQFAALGLTHVLAISGLHVGVLLFCLHRLLRLCRLSKESAALVLLAALPFYILLTGATPSVLRAGLMAMIAIIAALRNRLKDGLHLLAAACILLLAWDPYLLHSISFQLSFAVTAGLIIGVPAVRARMPAEGKLRRLYDLAAVTAVAQVVSLPLTIYYFNQYNLLSFIANLTLVPIISLVALPVGMAALVLGLLWQPIGVASAKGLTGLLHLLFEVVEALHGVHMARMIWPTPSLTWMVFYFVLCGVAVWLLTEGHARLVHVRKGWLLLVVAAAALLFYGYAPDRWNRHAVVSMLDVGQGDALLVRTPERQHILIDGGGTISFQKPEEAWRSRRDPFEIGRKVLVPLLMRRGVQQLDLLVITHLDTDHIGGLQAVIEQIPIKRVLWNGTLRPSKQVEQLLQALHARSIPVYTACAGTSWQMERSVSFTVLGPYVCPLPSDPAMPAPAARADLPLAADQNEWSLVTELRIYGHALLLPGDIGETTESRLLHAYATGVVPGAHAELEPGKVRLLKVAHHGSRYSTAAQWLEFWRPDAALISAGRRNSYGHPHPFTLDRLAQAESQIIRTDTGGEAQFIFTPTKVVHRSRFP